MITDVLVNLGLTAEEGEIYQSLLDNGSQSASELAKSTKVKRTYIYNVAKGLVDKGLISQGDRRGTTVFVPISPDKLLSLVHDKKDEAERLERTVEAVLPSLKSQFSRVEIRPVVSHYIGIEGLQRVYKDILNEGKDILLFRSLYDDKRSDIDNLVNRQLQDQIAKGIHTKTITPVEATTKETYLTKDKERLVERHIVKNYDFSLPSQIIVYGEKVAMISLKDEIVVLLIHNKNISDTYRKLFQLDWELTQKEHEEIVKNW